MFWEANSTVASELNPAK